MTRYSSAAAIPRQMKALTHRVAGANDANSRTAAQRSIIEPSPIGDFCDSLARFALSSIARSRRSTRRRADRRADDVPRRAEHAADERPRPEPRRQVDALRAQHARLERRRAASPTSISCRPTAGLPSTRQLTFTKDKNETSPQVVARRQLHRVPLRSRRADAAPARRRGRGGGGARRRRRRRRAQPDLRHAPRRRRSEARHRRARRRRRTSRSRRTASRSSTRRAARATSRSTRSPSPTSGRRRRRRPTQWTRHATGVGNWQWSPDGKRIYFVVAGQRSTATIARAPTSSSPCKPRNPAVVAREPLGVRRRRAAGAPAHERRELQRRRIHDLARRQVDRLPRHVGRAATSAAILEQNDYADLYLLNVATRQHRAPDEERRSSAKAPVSFSPDSKLLAFSAPDDFKFMHNEQIYVRPVDQPSAPCKKIGGNFDLDVRVGGRGGGGGGDGIETSFWSANGDTIYFGTGVRATTQFFAVSTRPARRSSSPT